MSSSSPPSPSEKKQASKRTKGGNLLSPDSLASQVQSLELIMAMWQGDDELEITSEDMESIRNLAEYLNLPIAELGNESSKKLKESLPDGILLTLTVHPESGGKERKLKIEVRLPLRSEVEGSGSKQVENRDLDGIPPPPSFRVRSVDWLKRSSNDRVSSSVKSIAERAQDQVPNEYGEMPETDTVGILMSVIETVSEVTLEELRNGGANSSNSGDETTRTATATRLEGVLRTWSYLPSLSSKEKRDDLVNYAADHEPPLTGFVLAGKPGLVVLEHPMPPGLDSPPLDDTRPSSVRTREAELLRASSSIDSFWSQIKSKSWADIPAFHKKVSERYREEYVDRCFQVMEEITEREEVGGRTVVAYGGKRNKSDLGSLQSWLTEKGLQGRIERVLGAEWGADD
ncbi:hypothetical protein IE53DRAFT_312273 [Violaceomyces palustris]|uniref:Uncharacterized protein n=1 Tax=Violaceomyces palustris TaxID=1673888 RepID=A0ACD0P2V7_9BASI|nr:hypothetical protein IE53DRAFT_312273 [Violaceomyces palustris]